MCLIIIFSLIISASFAGTCDKYNLPKNLECSGKSVHLTFDDGPNTTTTPKLFESLKKQGVPATFFISTHQLEKGDLSKKKLILNDMLDSNMTLATHGHDHNCYDYRINWQGKFEEGYSDPERREQINKSVDLLNQFTNKRFSNQELNLIRFPYARGISPSEKEINTMIQNGRYIKGHSYKERLDFYRANSPAMRIASEFNLDHVFWNIDSEDASSKYSEKNKNIYINATIEKFCNSNHKNLISLFHDTRSINSLDSDFNGKLVIEEIIEKSKCLGIKFVSMKEILSTNLKKGVITKSYSPKENISQIVKNIESINENETNYCTDKFQSKAQSCISKTLGRVNHCEGIKSFCIDGQWIVNASLKDKVCSQNMSSSTAKDVSKLYLKKQCKSPGEGVKIGNNEVSCYCQEAYSNTVYQWNCFYTDEHPPKRI